MRPALPFELMVEPREVPKDASEVMPRIEHPTQFDHRETVFNLTNESAIGRKRKEMWLFTFDRAWVCPSRN